MDAPVPVSAPVDTSFRQHILVPLDGSPLAELALTEALALSKLPNAEVTFLQVIPPIDHVILGVAPPARRGERALTTARRDGCGTSLE